MSPSTAVSVWNGLISCFLSVHAILAKFSWAYRFVKRDLSSRTRYTRRIAIICRCLPPYTLTIWSQASQPTESLRKRTLSNNPISHIQQLERPCRWLWIWIFFNKKLAFYAPKMSGSTGKSEKICFSRKWSLYVCTRKSWPGLGSRYASWGTGWGASSVCSNMY